MKALTFRGKHTIQFETINDPVIESDEDVIVSVKQCAICGSDLHVYHEHEKGIDHGTAMGHEFVGEVVEKGKAVKNFSVGDQVMSPFTVSCGDCYYCSIGLTSRCVKSQLFGWREKDKGLHGGQAEFVRVPLANSTLIKIPDGVTHDEALLLGDVMSTGFFCAHQANIKPGGIYVVIGCGPVGLMAILGAREYGAQKIFAVDSVDERLQHATTFGATPINYSTGNFEMLNEVSQGRGADGVLEAVGNKSAGKLAYDLVRPGGIISTVGVCNDANLSFSPVEAYNKNLTYKVGRCPARSFMEKIDSSYSGKKIQCRFHLLSPHEIIGRRSRL
ncbi:MAG: alcohol dehydrogenase catalytic domain-containing protein [Flammeovirgaceae bacterium]|nr:alcohol dehydrogenase catalytic domain-containing protein [Flammeovirgaceae bacterium]